MILDKLAEFSDSQGAITATAISTNVIDLGATNVLKDLGTGEPVWLVVQVDVTGTGAGTLIAELISDSVAALTSSPTTHYTSPAFVGTDMVVGKTLVQIPLPSSQNIAGTYQAIPGYEQFLGMRYTIASTVGAVKLSAFLVRNAQATIAYKSGYTAS